MFLFSNLFFEIISVRQPQDWLNGYKNFWGNHWTGQLKQQLQFTEHSICEQDYIRYLINVISNVSNHEAHHELPWSSPWRAAFRLWLGLIKAEASERAGQILQTLCNFLPISTHQYVSLQQCRIITEWNKEANQGESREPMLSNKGIPSTSNPEKDTDIVYLKCHVHQLFSHVHKYFKLILECGGISK